MWFLALLPAVWMHISIHLKWIFDYRVLAPSWRLAAAGGIYAELLSLAVYAIWIFWWIEGPLHSKNEKSYLSSSQHTAGIYFCLTTPQHPSTSVYFICLYSYTHLCTGLKYWMCLQAASGNANSIVTMFIDAVYYVFIQIYNLMTGI